MVALNRLYTPYEFRHDNKNNKVDFSSHEIKYFLEKFSQKITKFNLVHVFGICVTDSEDCYSLEHTERRKNITLSFTELNTFDTTIEAV
ncbi:7069_t:CDS:2 [Funneliformis caledonium]|uniref:7069_t:CDS:1 n=1 Tax=Funneliformis caledonium TaxID=1117310 RepID=A0A9N9ELF3_9GLOM|nr:7069_t:CDS:2 [Funneliformis caledonium]